MAPLLTRYWMVGIEPRMRVSSVTSNDLERGTLRSHLTSTLTTANIGLGVSERESERRERSVCKEYLPLALQLFILQVRDALLRSRHYSVLQQLTEGRGVKREGRAGRTCLWRRSSPQACQSPCCRRHYKQYIHIIGILLLIIYIQNYKQYFSWFKSTTLVVMAEGNHASSPAMRTTPIPFLATEKA